MNKHFSSVLLAVTVAVVFVFLGTFLISNASAYSPVFRVNGVATTNLVCNTSFTFYVDGYSGSSVWLVQTRDGASNYNGALNLPFGPNLVVCPRDNGDYDNDVYSVVNGQRGTYLGSVSITVGSGDQVSSTLTMTNTTSSSRFPNLYSGDYYNLSITSNMPYTAISSCHTYNGFTGCESGQVPTDGFGSWSVNGQVADISIGNWTRWVEINGVKSNIVSFTVSAVPSSPPTSLSAPTLISPSNGAILTANYPNLQWSAVTDAKAYQYKIYNSADSTKELQSWNTDYQFGSTMTVGTSLVGGSYLWKVRACVNLTSVATPSDSTCGAWSNLSSFNIRAGNPTPTITPVPSPTPTPPVLATSEPDVFVVQDDGSIESGQADYVTFVKNFYAKHPNVIGYDFLSILTSFHVPNYIETHMGIKWDASGFGQPVNSSISIPGVPDQLLGVSFFGDSYSSKYVESEDILKNDFFLLDHETGHQWLMYLNDTNPRLSDGQHYFQWVGTGFTRDGMEWNDVMGGWTWKDNGDGTWSVKTVQRQGFSNLSLYLMGMIPPTQVGKINVLVPNDPNNQNLNNVAGHIETITIDDIINKYGQRLPSYLNSKKDFKMAYILVVGKNQTASDYQPDLNVLSWIVKDFPIEWNYITYGKSTMNNGSQFTPTPITTVMPTITITPQPTVTNNPQPVVTEQPTPSSKSVDQNKIYGLGEIYDGDLIRAQGDIAVWIVKISNGDRSRRRLFGPQIFTAYGHLSFSKVKNVSIDTLNAFAVSNLVRLAGDQKVYELNDFVPGVSATRNWVPTYETFVQQGLNMNAVYIINAKEYNMYTQGAPLPNTGGTGPSSQTGPTINQNLTANISGFIMKFLGLPQ